VGGVLPPPATTTSRHSRTLKRQNDAGGTPS
jgi:hypothetical protein